MAKKIDTAASHPLYSVHPSVAYLHAIIANLPQKTGRSIDEWLRLVQESGPGSEKERRDWLRKEFKLGGTTAAIIAERAEGKADDNSDLANLPANSRGVRRSHVRGSEVRFASDP